MPESAIPKRGLGKGLNALIKTPSTVPVNVTANHAPPPDPETGEMVLRVSLDQIVQSPQQPRKRFNEEHLEELAQSISEVGLIQPLVVRRVGGKYELIAGERRWRACSRLNLETVPIVTREASDQQVLEIALIENLQREDLDPVEEAEAYRRLSVEYGLTHEDIAKHVSKTRSVVSNAIRLLDLDRDVQQLVSQKHISPGHAKVLLGVKSRPEQKMLADIVIRKKLNVRDTEELVHKHVHGTSKSKPAPKDDELPEQDDAYVKFIEDRLRGHYSTNVIVHHKEKKGKIEIEYYGNDDLNRVIELMGVHLD